MSINVAIYVRLSDEDRDKQFKTDDSGSIQNQKSMLTAYCEERRWNIYDIYCDDGFSGTDRSRPEFQRMLKDCEDGKIGIVLCKDQSRFSRDIVVVEEYINDKFLEWGVRFIGVVDNADSENEAYSMTRIMAGAFNEMYVKDISSKIRKTLKHKREKGQFTGSFAPYGYAIDPNNKNHLVVDIAAAEVVRTIFELYVKGNGYRAIVKHLNEKGIPNPTLYKQLNHSKFHNHNEQNSASRGMWTQSTIYKMLRNEFYIGNLVQSKSHYVSYKNHKSRPAPESEWIRFENAHEPIIDIRTWSHVQERLKSRIRTERTNDELSPLSGKVKCAVCGKPMKRNVYWNKKHTIKYYSLQCATYKTGAMNCPNCQSISGKQLEQFVVDNINDQIAAYCCMDDIKLVDRHREKLDILIAQLEMWNQKKSDIEKTITGLYKDKLDGIIDTEQYRIFSRSFTSESQEINTKCAMINEQIDELKKCNAVDKNREELIKKYSHIDELSRDVADEFIECIHIGELNEANCREVTIDWKF